MRILLYLTLCTSLVHADLLSQTDTFESGSAEGWGGGTQAGGSGPIHMVSGGSGGGGYLSISHTGFHVGTKNTAQWSGNYLAAPVTALRMDLKHISGDPLDIRIVVFGAGGMWASTGLQTINATWGTYGFGLTAADLVYVGEGTGLLDDTLSNVETLLIRHDSLIPTPKRGHPPHVTATMGIDNIHAVPEPGTAGYLLVGGIGIYVTRARRLRKEEALLMVRRS